MKWEYLTIYVDSSVDTRAKQLNTFGAAGWELVSVVGGGAYHVAYFKRKAK